VLAALAIGAIAGLYPAIRASRIPPAEAVRK
jgi:ABC-type antimicrobial peptide transport system permease subunit